MRERRDDRYCIEQRVRYTIEHQTETVLYAEERPSFGPTRSASSMLDDEQFSNPSRPPIEAHENAKDERQLSVTVGYGPVKQSN
jgi:hypothetical protein